MELTYGQVGFFFFILLLPIAIPAIKEAWRGGKH